MAVGIESASLSVLTRLAEPALRALILAIAAGFVLMLLRVRRTGVKLCVWTIVLVAALAMPALDLVMPALPLRVLPTAMLEIARTPKESGRAAPAARSKGTPPSQSDDEAYEAPAGIRSGMPTRTEVRSSLRTNPVRDLAPVPSLSMLARGLVPVAWPIALLGAYLLGVAVLLVRAAIGWATTQRFTGTTALIDDGSALARFHAFSAGAGLARAPRLAESGACIVPMTMGIARPVVVLPSGWRDWPETTLDAVLIHELAHVARRDALTQSVALLHRAVFWFSPLSWWLRHQLAQLAEYASDEAVLSNGIEQTRYAETLLGFFATLDGHRHRADWQVAMAQGAGAARRIERILGWTSGRSRLTTAITFGIGLLAIPSVGVVASVRPMTVAIRLPAIGPSPAMTEKVGAVVPPAVVSRPSDRPVTQAQAPQTHAPSSISSAPARRMMVLLFDTSGMPSADLRRAIDASRRWIDEKMTPSDLVSIASIGSTLNILSDFKSDATALETALESFASSAIPTPAAIAEGASIGPLDAFTHDVRLRGIKTLCENMTALQQQKAIMFFSEGVPRTADESQNELRAAESACARANTTINPIDVRGLKQPQPESAATASVSAPAWIQYERSTADSLGVLDQLTGTPALRMTTRAVLVDAIVKDASGAYVLDLKPEEFHIFEDGVEQALSVMNAVNGGRYTALLPESVRAGQPDNVPVSYYLLAYYASAKDVRPDGTTFHQIDVKVSRPGVEVHARKGYYTDSSPTSVDSLTFPATPPADAASGSAGRSVGRQSSDPVYLPSDPQLNPPVTIKSVQPKYTPDAIRAKIQGLVELSAIVEKDGTTSHVEITKSLDTTYGLDDQAIAALKEWRFKAGTVNGQPVRVSIHLQMTFTLR